MRTYSGLRFANRCACGVVALLPTVALAHPGHDGHELTWDLSHLAAHPWATGFWLLVLAASITSAVQLLPSRQIKRSASRAKPESLVR